MIQEQPSESVKGKARRQSQTGQQKYSKLQKSRLERIRDLLKKGLATNDIPLYKRAEIRRESKDMPVPRPKVIKYEYERFAHGMEFYLDKYMHPKDGKPIVLQGKRKKKKPKIVTPPAEIETIEEEVPMKRELSKEELLHMQSKMLISQLSYVSLQEHDTVNIDESLRSDNHLKILLGFTAFRSFF